MKVRGNLVFLLGFIIAFLSPLYSQEKERLVITNPFGVDSYAVTLEIDPSPKFSFSRNRTLRIRKVERAEMYEYKPKKPGKPYQHLVVFLELLERETETKPPKVDVVAVTSREFLDITEINGIVWGEPLADTSTKPKGSELLWFTEEDAFKVFIVNLKAPARVLALEQFIVHLMLLMEWEVSVRNVSPEDTEVLVDERKEEWKKREGEAYVLFHRISGHWKLLQLNWPTVPPQRPEIFSIPLPWPPWPQNSRR